MNGNLIGLMLAVAIGAAQASPASSPASSASGKGAASKPARKETAREKWDRELREDMARMDAAYWAKQDRERMWADREKTLHNLKDDVRVGMSAVAARASKWGEPLSVNRTTTAAGTTEQWVYGGNRYLYIRNGVVSGIQD